MKGRGSGVALIYKSSLTVKQQTVTSAAFECMETVVTAGNEVIRLSDLQTPFF